MQFFSFNAEVMLRYLFLIFIFTLRLENPKRIWKTVLKNSGLARKHIINKKNIAVHENSLANPFLDFSSNGKKEIHEIHP